MPDDEIQSLIKDIAKTGYVTEMITAGIFGDAGWQVADHSYFLDRDESKGREIDLLAVYRHTASSEKKALTVSLGLAVEVKKVTSKPWVVFTSPLTSYESTDSLFDTSMIRLHLQEIWFKSLYENHPVTQCQRFGRVSYQAFQKQHNGDVMRNTKDARNEDRGIAPNFSAFVSAFKGTSEITAFLRQGVNAPLRDAKQIRTYEIGIVHGLIVLAGKLYQAVVNDEDSLDVSEADYIPYIFNYNSKEYGSRRLLIDIVTVDRLPAYLKVYQEWINERASYCLNELS